MSRLEDYANWLLKNKAKVGTEEFNRVAGAYTALRSNEQAGITGNEQLNNKAVQREAQLAADRKTYAPTVGMSGIDLARAGAGKAISDTGLGAGQMVGLRSRADVLEGRRLDAPLMETTAGMAGNIAGNVGMALAPGGAMMGAGKVASKLTQADALAQALMKGGKAVMAPSSIPTAVGVGATQGLIQPSTSTGETMANMGFGTAGGAAVPSAMRAGQVAKAAVEPFYASGQNQIVGRALNEATGGQVPQTMQALRSAAPLIPGSFPTAGQAGNNAGLAALERTAVATDPVAMNQMQQRLAQQNEARVAALEGVSGAGGKREFFKENRRAAADELYGKARAQGIEPASLTPEAQANIADFQARVPEDVLSRAKEIAKISGVNMDNESSVQGLHWIKKAIDSKIDTAVRSGDSEMARAYQGLQKTLLSGMDEVSPAYGEARRTFSAMSKPINEMDVAQEITNKAVNPLRGTVQPAAYARALNDQTASRVTGMPNATLANTLSPESLGTMNAVKDDLVRSDFANTAGRGVGSDTVQKLAYSNLMAKSGLPNWMRDVPGAGVVGRMADIGYKRSNDEMRQKLAQALLNPQDTAALMEAGIVTPQMQALMDGLRRGGAAVGVASPYLLNTAKE